MDLENMLTVEDVAQILHVSPLTVRYMFRQKRLRGFKFGKSWRTTRKILQEDIENVARSQANTAPETPRRRTKRSVPSVAATVAPEESVLPADPAPKKAARQRVEKRKEPTPDDMQQTLF
ncbi:MAG TPA: helix-turn-helix domain-containing protein [Candidatus Hydrogenedentes bacterium]|nr:helix-turn-helix domain-containing protein [Candidatus Hydrogenedentota bacterium]HNT89269.1 helix-turn-helix domain-containing protein [Candidatus Hydrogenedentota bacterium]